MAERKVTPIKILMFQSKRKGTVSAKIVVPSNCSPQILSKNVLPTFVNCKLWRRKEIGDCNYARDEEKLTLWGINSTYV